MHASLDPSRIDLDLDSRAISFENPTGARGAGGAVLGGRKGAPSRRIEPGETVVLADLEGPGTIRHVWMTFPPARPERMRALVLEVFYDEAAAPSISVPALDFFGLPTAAPRPCVGAALCAGGPRLQRVPADSVPPPDQDRGHQRVAAADGALLPARLHARAQPRARDGPAPRLVPAREPDPAEARLHDRGRTARARPIPRLQRRRAHPAAEELRLVRRRRAEDLQDGDGALPTICGTGPRTRRQWPGGWAALCAVRRRAA